MSLQIASEDIAELCQKPGQSHGFNQPSRAWEKGIQIRSVRET